ncbi:MAG: type II CRISPR-associated endonuclease Cas1, partial [Bacteroidales bacterium]|nr:type II CRISPR-associated endonuclease Cas1 [Bacteroidales bacterium]
LLEKNCAVISCDSSRLPVGLMLPLCGNSVQTERMREQIEASLPLKKQLWQQTVIAKIRNQASILKQLRQVETGNMQQWATDVKSGDSDNKEAQAAAYYWKKAFPTITDFVRSREGESPNNLLNYGYAILRAVIARALISSGLLPTFGIHHKNKYNAYCLADDVMEPYRPYVDKLVMNIFDNSTDCKTLTKEIKTKLLEIPVMEVNINDLRRPLMVAASITTSSLQKCFAGESRKILYPAMS